MRWARGRSAPAITHTGLSDASSLAAAVGSGPPSPYVRRRSSPALGQYKPGRQGALTMRVEQLAQERRKLVGQLGRRLAELIEQAVDVTL
jgi:hypothetical protein